MEEDGGDTREERRRKGDRREQKCREGIDRNFLFHTLLTIGLMLSWGEAWRSPAPAPGK